MEKSTSIGIDSYNDKYKYNVRNFLLGWIWKLF